MDQQNKIKALQEQINQQNINTGKTEGRNEMVETLLQ